MALIGIADAAKRLDMTNDGARRALRNAGVELVEIHPRALAVEEKDLQKFDEQRKRRGYGGRGRPRGTYKPSSPRSKAHKEVKGES